MWTTEQVPTNVAEDNSITVKSPKNKSVLGDVFTYGFASIMTRAITFFLLPLYTQYLTPAEYGVLDLVTQIGTVINTVMMFGGMGAATMTFYLQAKSEDEKKQVVSSMVLVISLGIMATAAIVIPFSSIIVRQFHLPLSGGIFALGCATILSEVLPSIPYTLMLARVEPKRFMSWHLTSMVLRLLATIGVVAILHWGVRGVLLVRFATSITAGSILLLIELRNHWQKPSRNIIRRIVGYALPFVPSGVFYQVQKNGQRFFLLASTGPADLGLYALGYTLTGIVSMLTVLPFHKVWSAKMYEVYESENAPAKIGAVATKFVVLYMCGALPLLFFGHLALKLLSSSDYERSQLVFVPLLISGIIETFTNFSDQVFIVRHKTKYKPYITFTVAVFALAIYSVIVPRYGILGAAYGAAATVLIRSAIIFFVARRIFVIRFETGKLAWLLTLSVLTSYLSSLLTDSWLGLTLKVVLLLVWGYLIYWSRIIPRSDFLAAAHFAKSTADTVLVQLRVKKNGNRIDAPHAPGE